MSYLKRFPIGLNAKTIIGFFVAVHILIFVNVFWELFAWMNQLIVDPTFSDPIVFAWIFWSIESLSMLYILGKKLTTSHIA